MGNEMKLDVITDFEKMNEVAKELEILGYRSIYENDTGLLRVEIFSRDKIFPRNDVTTNENQLVMLMFDVVRGTLTPFLQVSGKEFVNIVCKK